MLLAGNDVAAEVCALSSAFQFVANVARQMLSAADQREASMTVKRVSAQHFRSYALTATNDVGRRRAFVELVRRRGHGPRRPSPGERQAARPTQRQDAASALSRDDRGGGGGEGE